MFISFFFTQYDDFNTVKCKSVLRQVGLKSWAGFSMTHILFDERTRESHREERVCVFLSLFVLTFSGSISEVKQPLIWFDFLYHLWMVLNLQHYLKLLDYWAISASVSTSEPVTEWLSFFVLLSKQFFWNSVMWRRCNTYSTPWSKEAEHVCISLI